MIGNYKRAYGESLSQTTKPYSKFSAIFLYIVLYCEWKQSTNARLKYYQFLTATSHFGADFL